MSCRINKLIQLIISKAIAERVEGFDYLGSTIDNTFHWNLQSQQLLSSCHSRLHLLGLLRKFRAPHRTLDFFYKSCILE